MADKDNIKKKEYLKEYYWKNKDTIKEKMKEKIKCECGGEYTKYNKGNHEKTQRHIDGVKKIKSEDEIKKEKDMIDEKIKSICNDSILSDIKEKIIKELCEKIEISIKK